MAVTRRHLVQSLALAAAGAAPKEAPAAELPIDALRRVSEANGINLSDDRLQVLKLVLESHLPQLKNLRDFPIDDSVPPTQGILSY